MTFRGAFTISLVIHSLILTPFSGFVIQKQKPHEMHEMTVDYFVIKETPPPKAIAKNVNAKIVETPKVEIRKKVDVRPAPNLTPDKSREEKDAKSRLGENAAKQARLKSTKEYINYYQLVREQIRQRLKENYKDYYREGDVMLSFILNSNGSVDAVYVDSPNSTSDKTLQRIAEESVREASPFPSFPKALNLPKMSFSLQVSFKKC